MRDFPRYCAALALILLLVVTGQGLAVARGTPVAAGQITLCTGSGPVMVFVDDKGQPTAPPHYCPDGALALFNMVATVPALPPRAPRLLQVSFDIAATPGQGRPRPGVSARAPPVMV